jgi:hypothetical protein
MDTLVRIKAGFETEIESPTDEVKGEVQGELAN